MMYMCWYCKHAYRETNNKVCCQLKTCYRDRTQSVCDHFIRDPWKENDDEKLGI